jgi:hypothetical protein
MRYAKIYSVPSPGRQGFVWRWCTPDRSHESPCSFTFYLDCFQDANRRGYAIELQHARGTTAQAGALARA